MSTKFKTLQPDLIKYIVVHCSATPPEMDIGAEEIDLWHRQRGWAGIGYHHVIRRNGRIEDGRPLDRPGAHAQGFNIISWGVCLVGGVDKAGPYGKATPNYTQEQLDVLRILIEDGYLNLAPTAEVVGHRDLPSPHARLKECPSFDVAHWLKTNEVIA